MIGHLHSLQSFKDHSQNIVMSKLDMNCRTRRRQKFCDNGVIKNVISNKDNYVNDKLLKRVLRTILLKR